MIRVKICGITNLNDALAAAEAGADLLGFNFYLKSPRFIEQETCRAIASVLRRDFPRLVLVGVFVNASVVEIRARLTACQLHLAQLHGDEPPELLAALGPQAFKALRLSAQTAAETAVYPFYPPSVSSLSPSAPALLVDAAVKGLYGGSGVVADWAAAARLARQIPLLLAGGLTPENVSAAIEQVQPWGVDTASGVEASPGLKDKRKMQAFIAAARESQNAPKTG